MFSFFKRRETPEGLGNGLASGFSEVWFPKIDQWVMEYCLEFDDINVEEKNNLFYSFILVHCIAIHVAIEASDISIENKEKILKTFWHTLGSIILNKKGSEAAQKIESTNEQWFKEVRNLITEPSESSSLSLGKAFWEMSFPQKAKKLQQVSEALKENKELIKQNIKNFKSLSNLDTNIMKLVFKLDHEFSLITISCADYVNNVIKGVRLK